MLKCWKTMKDATVSIEVKEDTAIVSYSIDPRLSHKVEKRFKLSNADLAQSISNMLKREVTSDDMYNLKIAISTLTIKDSTERKNLTPQKTREALDSFITTHLPQQLSQLEEKVAPRQCAIL